MREGIADLITVIRSASLAGSLPRAAASAYQGSKRGTRVFDRVVHPLIAEVYADPAACLRMRTALHTTSMTVNFVLLNYAEMAGVPYDGELSILAGSIARLYDDMIDNTADPDRDPPIGSLFAGGPFDPATDEERLLARLFHAIDARLGRPQGAPFYAMLAELHEYQALSRAQKEPDLDGDRLRKITQGKGGTANVVLFALLREHVSPAERELMMELGEAFQLLDDYLDHDDDLRQGITTLIIRGEATLADVARRLKDVTLGARACYGPRAARSFGSVLYLMMIAIFVKRRQPWIRPRARRAALLALIGDGDPAVPPPGGAT